MSDIPANAIDVNAAEMGDLNIYEKVANLIESGHRIVAIPVAEPPTLAKRIDQWVNTHSVTNHSWQDMIDDLGLVSRDDVPTETLQRLDATKLYEVLTVTNAQNRGGASWVDLANAIFHRFGVSARPTVTQVMEALGGEHRDGAWLLHGQRLLPEEYVGDLLVGLGAAHPDEGDDT